MTPAHAEVARARLESWLGIDVGRGGIARAIERHLTTRLAALGRPDAAGFAALLDAPGSTEAQHLVDAATVPHSWLFRDASQLAQALPPRSGLRIWVAGCANGEEAYTVAALALIAGRDVQVLATDVNQRALERARGGRYDAWTARELPATAARWFRRGADDAVEVDAALRARVTFARHSLALPPPRPADASTWDVVICRNVLIYFARDRALEVVARIAGVLAPGGLLALGASDVLAELPPGLSPTRHAGRLVLVRDDRAPRPRPHLAAATPATAIAPLARPPLATPAIAAPTCLADAAARFDAGDLDGALALLEPALAIDPLDADAHLLAGLAHHGRGAHEPAVARLRAALCLAPQAWLAALYFALASERLGRWDDARRGYALVLDARGVADPLVRARGRALESLRATRRDVETLAARRVHALAAPTPSGMP